MPKPPPCCKPGLRQEVDFTDIGMQFCKSKIQLSICRIITFRLYNRAFMTQSGWPATLQKMLESLFDDGCHIVILIFSETSAEDDVGLRIGKNFVLLV